MANQSIKLKRVFAGFYTYTDSVGIILEIFKNDEGDSAWFGEWVITSGQDYSDPMPLLRDCRLALEEHEIELARFKKQLQNMSDREIENMGMKFHSRSAKKARRDEIARREEIEMAWHNKRYNY